MLKTTLVGIGLIIIGLVTAVKFSNSKQAVKSAGAITAFIGAFLLWNGFVANYNSNPSFAIFD
tara:strand:+ start:376 stop:564 length:189 start_codon:yes stop_codon:yes gene_type:complete